MRHCKRHYVYIEPAIIICETAASVICRDRSYITNQEGSLAQEEIILFTCFKWNFKQHVSEMKTYMPYSCLISCVKFCSWLQHSVLKKCMRMLLNVVEVSMHSKLHDPAAYKQRFLMLNIAPCFDSLILWQQVSYCHIKCVYV